MEFYLDRLYNYQAVGGQSWNVDFARLPASAQDAALAAIRAPGTPKSLVALANLQKQYPSAFERVSSLSTLPAPDLGRSMDGPFPFDAPLDLILAYYNEKVKDTAQDMSTKSKAQVVELSNKTMCMADAVKDKAEEAAAAALGGGLAGGIIGTVGGATSLGFGIKGGLDVKTHGKAMKEQTSDMLKNKKYGEDMERTVKQLRDGAQNNRAEAQRLNGYADEINTPDGMSPASRKKLDDDIAAKDAQLKDIKDQRQGYVEAKVRAFEKSEDMSLSAAKRADAKAELERIKAGEKRFMDDLGAKEKRLIADRDALADVKKMDAAMERIKVDTKRLNELSEKPAPTPAEAKEMLELRSRLPEDPRTVVEARGRIQTRIDDLKSEAARMDSTAASLQKAAQADLEAREQVWKEKERELNEKVEAAGNEVRAGSAGAQSISAMTPLGSAPGTFESQKADAEKEHVQAESRFEDQKREVAQSFGNEAAEMVKAARDFWKEVQSNYNDYMKTTAGNV